jgi:protein-disulfide isomerase
MDRRPALYLLLGLFALVSVLLVWSFIYRNAKTFETGKPPNLPQVAAPVPTLPDIRATDPARGSADKNAVVITEFADFSCLYCRASEPELQSVLQENKDVRQVWRDMPVVSESPLGMLAASAGRCAGEQNHFWEMHNALMSSAKLDSDTINQLAKNLGLNASSFSDCLASGKHVASIQQDIEIAREHNLTGAPTFFIGKTVLTGYVTAADLRWAILKARLGQ